MKHLYKIILLFVFLFSFTSNIYSQSINLVRFNNTASYTSGSGVSVIINPTGIFDLNNKFILELSDIGGGWSAPKILTTVDEFYVPVINGTLPTGLAAGSYKLRVRSTLPALIIETNSFAVVAGGSITVPAATSALTSNSNFFNCIDCGNNQTIFGTLNRSDIATVGATTGGIPINNRNITVCNFDANYNYNIKLVNVLGGTPSIIINHTNGVFDLPSTLGIGTYVFEIEKTNNTSSSVFSIIFLFHGNATNLGNSTSEQVCVNEIVTFNIETSLSGIGRNYSGSKYTIDFGDSSTPLMLTHAQLMANPVLSHTFTAVSCDKANSYFIVQEKLFNKGISSSCNNYFENGLGVNKNVNTSIAPIAAFTLTQKQCITNNIFADNTTTVGSYGTAGCLHDVNYYWYYKKPGDVNFTLIPANSSWINTSKDLTIPSSFVNIEGCWEIKLEAVNPDLCQTVSEVTRAIKIEAIPIPSFTYSPVSPICAGTTINFTNTSNVVNLPCQEPTYTWSVTPVIGTPATTTGFQFVNSTTYASINSSVVFTQPGSYTITLNVTNSCGTFSTVPKTIVVFGDPTVSFSPNSLVVCSSAPANYALDFSLASNKPIYSATPYQPKNYSWTVSGTGITASDYSFTGGTTASSQYPKIIFNAFHTYLIKVKVDGNCLGTNEATFTFTLNEIPTVTNTNLTQTICSGGTTSALPLTSSMGGTTYSWTVTSTVGTNGFPTSGSGNTVPNVSLNNMTNTVGTVTYIITPLNNGCSGPTVNFVVTVTPKPFIASQTKSICSATNFTFPPISGVSNIIPSGTTYTWTNPVSSPVGAITGGSDQTIGVSSISQTLTNITNASATLTYTVIPTAGNCSGLPFTVTITVNPMPTATIGGTTSVCVNTTSPVITFIGSNGTAPYTFTYTINAGSNQTITTSTGSSVTIAVPTSTPGVFAYSLISVKDASSTVCSQSQTGTATVIINPLPASTISGTSNVCVNTPSPIITFTGSNGTAPYIFSYTINGGSTQTINTTSGNSVTIAAPTSTAGTYIYNLINVQDSSSSNCSKSQNGSATITVNALPTISTQPLVTQSICIGGTIPALIVSYGGGVGTASYQWYSNATNSITGGISITGATSASYIPSVFNTTGNFYYYAIVSLSGTGCGTATSNVSEVIVVTDPIVTSPLTTQTICQGTIPTNLTVVASGGSGTFNYQWFSNTTGSNTGGTLITGATVATYTPLTTLAGTKYYYCEITQTGIGCKAISAVATVIVVAAPTIATQPLPSTICLNGIPADLSVIYSNGTGTATYQWFSNSTNTNSGGTSILGATNSSYTSPTSTVNVLYYYCVVSFSSGGCSSATSNTAAVTVNALPTISSQPLATQSICIGGTIPALIVSYGGGVGTASYQWYSNATNSITGGISITGATSASYIPSVFSTAGNFYFYAIISLSGTGCGTATSNVSEVIAVSDPTVTAPLTTQTICQGTIPTNLTVVASGGSGTFTYQWFSNTTGSNTGGTLITGATADIYMPLSTIAGTKYYYCEISQTGLGCKVTSTVATVIIVTAPTISTQPLPSTVCLNGIPTDLSVIYSNGTGTATYQWFSNSTNTNSGGTSILGATNSSYTPPTSTVNVLYYYCVVSFSSGGCSSATSNTAAVTVNALPTITTQPLATQSICIGGIIPALTVSYTGGVGIATYKWYSNIRNSNTGGTLISGGTSSSYIPPVFNSAGNFYYYAEVNLSGSGCGFATSTVAEVKVLADPTVTSPLTTQTLCQGSTPIDLSVTATGGVGTYSYQWYSNTSNSASGGSAIVAGTINTFVPPTITVGTQYYYCIVSQTGLGCSVTSAVVKVIIVAAPAITSQPQPSSVCESGTPTPLTVAYSNGTGTAIYQWYSNTTNSIIGSTSIAGAIANTYNPPASTVGKTYYYCVVTFSTGGCTSVTSNTTEVIVNQIPVVLNEKLKMCSGDALNFTPQSGNGNSIPNNTLYKWSFASMSPLGSVSGATNQNVGQSIFNQILVNNTNQVATITYTLTPKAAICSGNTFTIEVTVNPKPKVNFSGPDQVVCNESSNSVINLSSITPGTISYSWNANVPNGITGAILSGTDTIPNQTLTNTTNTSLTVTYTATATLNNNNLGCKGPTSTYSITVNPTITTSAVLSNYNGYGVSVFGGKDGFVDLTVTGGSGNYNYIWSGPNGFTASTQDINGVYAGNYTVKINDGYCNPTVLTFALTQPPELLVQEDTAVHVNLLCFGNTNGILGVAITQESVAPYDFQLVNSKGIIIRTIMDSALLNQSFNGLSADVYKVIVTDANGGVKMVTGLTITQPTDIVISAATTPITCYGGNNASITLNVVGGTAPYLAQWDNLATGLYQNNLSAGFYAILVTDANNCTKSITVEIPDAPIFKMNPTVTQISCFGAHDGSIKLNLVGGIPAVKLVWSDNSVAGTTRNNLGPGTYTATIIDGTPCEITNTFVIIEPQALVLAANITNALDCNNANSGAINLLVSGGTTPFSYAWSNGSITENLNSIPAGNYLVTVTDARKCTVSGSYSIVRPSPIVVKVETVSDFNCETKVVKQSFVAKASGGVPPYQFVWSSGIISGPYNEIMNTSQNGLIVLNTLDSRNCSATYTFDLAIPELGAPSFTTTSIGYSTYGLFSIEDPIQFTNTASGDYTNMAWDFGDGTFSDEKNPIHIYKKEGAYIITQTVTYPFGCVYVHTVTLQLEKGYSLIPPTGFTPNNDGINDYFAPLFLGLNDIHFDVYDTWGSLIYSESGENIRGWDGKINNKEGENGNYYFKITAKTFYGKSIKDQGALVLIN